MKKKILIISIAVIIVLFGGGYWLYLNSTGEVDTFCLQDYSKIIDEFPSDIVLGPVDDAKTAKKQAEKIWIDIYGKSVKKEKPYKISFDEDQQVWLVQGTLPRNYNGGTAQILIQKSDGKVLAVWHYK